jgi:predicted amidohydrolase
MPAPQRIRIAAAQPPVGHDVAANGEAVRELMRMAREDAARLIQFPEGAICGYVAEPMAADQEAVRRQLQLTASLAGKLGLWVVVGAVHYLTPPHWPHNSLYIISDRGELAGRYDKRICSYTELTRRYSPGFEPLVFEVDGFRFGCATCIEVNFPEIFLDYRERDVDCVLFSSHSEDPIFEVLARGHAAAHNYWISVSVTAQGSTAMPASVIGPHGYSLARCPADGKRSLVVTDLDPHDPALDTALNKARPWRAQARAGDHYRARRVHDQRSSDHTSF